MNWSELNNKQKAAIQKSYESGKDPGEIAPSYGLKPKQVSDQAYRKGWKKKQVAKKVAKKVTKKIKKKAGKKAKKK